MGTLYYDFSLDDSEIRKQFKNLSVEYNEKRYVSIIVKNSDGNVSIPISDLGIIGAVYIKSEHKITATINGEAVAVKDFLFVTLTALTSLTASCTDLTGKRVDVAVWGKS